MNLMARMIICFVITLCIFADHASPSTTPSPSSKLPESDIYKDFLQFLINLFDKWLQIRKSSSPLSTNSTQGTTNETDSNSTSCCSKCNNSRYRSIDGSCNNLENPTWGTANKPFGELVPNNYADGVYALPVSSEGKPLPNPREISLTLFDGGNVIDTEWTLITMEWGQFLVHDIALADGSKLLGDANVAVTCCENGKLTSEAKTNPLCAPILIPKNDVANRAEGIECMEFVRSISTRDTGSTSPNETAYPINGNTDYIDMSVTYGSTDDIATSLRERRGGRLLTTERNGKKWPPQASNTSDVCPGAFTSNEPCYVAGDIRVNQNPQIAVLQIILLKEHNRIAQILSKLNANWDDETIYQETRRILTAIVQRIHYYEYLPIILGRKNMENCKLIYSNENNYVNDYNSTVKTSIYKEFATAAFRFLHTLIRGRLQFIKESRAVGKSIRLSDWFDRPLVLEKENGFEDLTRGLSFQPMDKSDQYFDFEITQYLFRRNKTIGQDLRAIDIQRSRDHGLGTYVEVREFCGLSVPKTFDDLLVNITKRNVATLKTLYEKVEDIDVTVGGSLENNVPGTLIGPTFLCISLRQFYVTRVGDRYFYENGNDPTIAFTPSQLKSIRKGASVARLLCDNGYNIKKMQPKAFEPVSSRNKLVSCDQLPAVDLTLW